MKKFYPVFLAHFGPHGGIELQHPNADTIALTGEAPDGFEGAYCYYSPPVYPVLLISGGGLLRRVPNRVVENETEWRRYVAEFHARRGWRYETPGDGIASLQQAIKINDENRRANKERGDAAIKAFDAKQGKEG
jgi:hypothetical protein